MLRRLIENKLNTLHSAFRIVYISGARQVGKTTLIKSFAQKINAKYISFDDPKNRETALAAPDFFLDSAGFPLALDEVQKVPEIIDFLKIRVDELNRPGLVIMTGSSNIFHNPKIYESLSGRMAILKLYPFSTFELKGYDFNLVETLFDDNFHNILSKVPVASYDEVIETTVRGLFPEIALNKNIPERQWFESYIETRVKKDINELTEKKLHKLDFLPKMLRILANQTSSLLNISNLAKDLKIKHETAKNYLGYLQALYLVDTLQPYFTNLSKTITKTPKLYFNDTGLVSFLLNLTKDNIDLLDNKFGYLLENHVYLELQKHIQASLKDFKLYFFRDDKKNEVDFVIQSETGELIGIEVKSKSLIKPTDLKGLKVFKSTFGTKIKRLFVFYGGSTIQATKIDNEPVFLLPYRMIY